MADTPYVPPKVWVWDKANGGAFASTNRPIAGATHDKDLPRGQHPLQLYSLATPNGVKVTIMLEELVEAGLLPDYDAWLLEISGDQFGSGFVGVNPNSKIPAMMDYSGDMPVRLFESGSILIHLAEKFGAFLPKSGPERTETMNWLMWQMGSAPFVGGGFGGLYSGASLHRHTLPQRPRYFLLHGPGRTAFSDRSIQRNPHCAEQPQSTYRPRRRRFPLCPWLRGGRQRFACRSCRHRGRHLGTSSRLRRDFCAVF